MDLFRRTAPASTSSDTPPNQERNPAAEPRRLARRALQVVIYGLLTGAATTAGKAAMDAMIWLIHHH